MSEIFPAFPLDHRPPDKASAADWLWREVEIRQRVEGYWLSLSGGLHACVLLLLLTGWPQVSPAAAQTAEPLVTLELKTELAEVNRAQILPPIFPGRRPNKPPGPGGQPNRPLPKLGAENRGPQAIVTTPPAPTRSRQLIRLEKARLRMPAEPPRLPSVVIPAPAVPVARAEFELARMRGVGLTFNPGGPPALSARPRRRPGSRVALRDPTVSNPIPRLALSAAPPGEDAPGADAPISGLGKDTVPPPGLIALNAEPAPVGSSLRLPAGNLDAKLSIGPVVGPGSPAGIPDGVPDADGGSDAGPGGWSGGEGGLVVPGIFVAPAGPVPLGAAIVGPPKPSEEESSTRAPSASESKPTSAARSSAEPAAKTTPSAPHPPPARSRAREILEAARSNGQGDRPGYAAPVFTTYVFLASLTSQSSTWKLHYSEREFDGTGGALSPPQVLRKADPCYPSDVRWERMEGAVIVAGVITAEGAVAAVAVLEGLDPRIDARAAEAFARSLFQPARKDARAVAVDVVVEIPFRLAPCY